MIRRLTLSAMLLVTAVVSEPAEAGRWIPSSCVECTGKLYWVVFLEKGAGDSERLARALIERHGGYLRAVWPDGKAGEKKFAVEATQDEVRGMLADERVTLIDGRKERYFRSPRTAASAELGSGAEAGGNSWTTGPYKYDGAGNITQIGPNSWSQTDIYHYDRVNRLRIAQTSARNAASPTGAVQWSGQYGYDAFGNMLTKTTTKGVGAAPETKAIEVNAATNRLSSATYDLAGNLLSDGANTMTYDALNRVTSRTVANSGTERYLYTADDERVATILPNGSTRYTIRGPDQKVLREFERAYPGAPLEWKKDYIWRGALLLATIASDGKTTHYHLDHLGTPRMLTDGSGNLVTMNAYLPFGEEIPDGEPDTERLKFTGHERDNRAGDATALDYMHALLAIT